ncbi:MAG: sugar transferase [Actinomycetota bacterium]|nr:sugar transferase [Actinomycetota bacterium]
MSISSRTDTAAAPTVAGTPKLVSVPNASDRPPRRSGRAKYLLMTADVMALLTAIVATHAVVRAALEPAGQGSNGNRFLLTGVATLPAWLAVFSHQRLYNIRFITRRIDETRRIVNASFLGVMVVALTGSVDGFIVPRSALVVMFFMSVTLVFVEREIARRVFASRRTRGTTLRRVVMVGANPEGQELAAMLQAEPWLGYRVLGFVDDHCSDPQPVAGIPLLGSLAEAGQILRVHNASGVIVATSAIDSEITNRLARDLLDQGVHVELSSTLRDISSQRLTVRPLGRFPVVYVEPIRRDGWRAAAKRAFDIAGAALALVLLAPVVAVAAIAVKLDTKGHTLFRQTRVGRDSQPFAVLKLRTMVLDAESMQASLLAENEADGPLFKMQKDPRVTRVGRVLRRTSIDEIPQLWNVLRGSMSLVGPRPALPHETEEWDTLLTQRLRVKPGITGMWQVNGRSQSTFADYTRLDLYYVDNWSLTSDLAILFKTIPVVLGGKGAV